MSSGLHYKQRTFGPEAFDSFSQAAATQIGQ